MKEYILKPTMTPKTLALTSRTNKLALKTFPSCQPLPQPPSLTPAA